MRENKFLFAHYLRGVAAISVVLTHYGSAFFNANPILSSYINIPLLDDTSYPWLFRIVPPELPGFLAVFGVAIFFMISGFVIPISIEKYNIVQFILKRFQRLYPTYFFVFLLNMSIAILGFYIFFSPESHYPYNKLDIFSTLFIGFGTFVINVKQLDPVAWTLAIEILFYIIAALFFNLCFKLRKNKIIALTDVLFLGLALNIAVLLISKNFEEISSVFTLISIGSVTKALYLISFMLFGTVFYLRARGRIDIKPMIVTLSVQYMCLIFVSTKIHPAAMYLPPVLMFSWFGIVILVFTLFYVVRDRITVNRYASYLGDISYPLYLCHSYVGYFIIGIILHYHLMPKTLAIFIPLPLVIYISWLIHVHIELKNTNSLKLVMKESKAKFY